MVAENPAEVSVSGLALPFGERYLLRHGQYQVTAIAEGYHPMTTEVSVGDADSQSVELVLLPLPGLLSVNTQPSGARVSIDGEA